MGVQLNFTGVHNAKPLIKLNNPMRYYSDMAINEANGLRTPLNS